MFSNHTDGGIGNKEAKEKVVRKGRKQTNVAKIRELPRRSYED